jgi:CBS domain-containing protein
MDTKNSPNPVAVLQSIQPFNYLGVDTLNKLAAELEYKTYPRGTYVFRQGESSKHILFLVAAGIAEVVITNEKGYETAMGLRRQHEFFGETVVLTDGVYPASVKAVDDLSCYLLARELLEELIQKHPEFSGFFSHILTERMRLLYEEIVAEQAYNAYSSVESSLFRKRIIDVMSSPVITCRPQDTISNIARIMKDNNISALIVVDEQQRPQGLITEKDIIEAIIISGTAHPDEITAARVMKPGIVQLPPDAYFNQALLAIAKHQVKQLAVVDRGQLIGIVTIMDLIKTRGTGTLVLTHDIETKTDLNGLCAASKEVDNVLNALVAEKAPVPQILEIMAEFHDRLTRRVIYLMELEMVSEGYGKPPASYCWVNMGSAGRREQTLRTDQDNAIIYADPPPGEEDTYARYFLMLGEKVVEGLANCGFVKCNGGVMASNPLWCRCISDWKKVAGEWISKRDPDNIRMLTILLDYRSIYGDLDLPRVLWDAIFDTINNSTAASHLLTQDDLKFRAPLSILGGFITEKSGPYKNQINLKASACLHIVNCIRIFAITSGITEASTFGRLKELIRLNVIKSDDAELIEAAYEALLMFRIRENLKKVKQGKPADNYINPYNLSKREQSILKDAFSAVNRLQKITSNTFSVFWLNYITR